MKTQKELQDEHEAELARFLATRGHDGAGSDWALVRALVHKAVHVAAERRAGEFCAVATLLAEMLNHAHQVMHPGQQHGSAPH
jgi:hypothetical protein